MFLKKRKRKEEISFQIMIAPSPITQRGARRGEAFGFASPFGSSCSRFVYHESSCFRFVYRESGSFRSVYHECVSFRSVYHESSCFRLVSWKRKLPLSILEAVAPVWFGEPEQRSGTEQVPLRRRFAHY